MSRLIILAALILAIAGSAFAYDILCAASEVPGVEAGFIIAVSGENNASVAKLSIYDIMGRRVAGYDEPINGAGEYSITWDREAKAVSSGVYLYELEVGGESAVRKMVLK